MSWEYILSYSVSVYSRKHAHTHTHGFKASRCVCVCLCACLRACVYPYIYIHCHMRLPQPHNIPPPSPHNIPPPPQCKLQYVQAIYAQVLLGKSYQRNLQRVTTTGAGRVFALVAGLKSTTSASCWRSGDRAPACIGASWSVMQQQHATCTWPLGCWCPVPWPSATCAGGVQ